MRAEGTFLGIGKTGAIGLKEDRAIGLKEDKAMLKCLIGRSN